MSLVNVCNKCGERLEARAHKIEQKEWSDFNRMVTNVTIVEYRAVHECNPPVEKHPFDTIHYTPIESHTIS